MSDSDSTEPNESFEERVKKVMMKQFDAIEDNMRLFLKQEVAKRNHEVLDQYIRKYLEAGLTIDIEDRVYKKLQSEIYGRLDQIAVDIGRCNNKVNELAVEINKSMAVTDTLSKKVTKLDEQLQEISNWTPYNNGWFDYSPKKQPYKIQAQIFRNLKSIDNISAYMEEKFPGFLYTSRYDEETKSLFSLKQPPNPTVQLPAARKQDPILLLKDLPLLHM